MVRPCFLVLDREFPGSISTRKLVIETAKLNVITAYSGEEAIDTLKRFPAVSGVVLDASVKDVPTEQLIHSLKEVKRNVPVIAIAPPGSGWCPSADYHLEFFEPARLLDLLMSLDPEQAAAIKAHDQELNHGDGDSRV